MNRPLLFVAAVAFCASGTMGFVSACTDNGSSSPGESRPVTNDAAQGDARVDPDSGAPQEDAAPAASTCEITRAYMTGCLALYPDAAEPLTCGEPKFDAWCDLNDKAINSASYRRAEAMCLTTKNCDGLTRRDCEYRTYATATPTAAQTAVVAAYCQTCEPADALGCAKRKTTYDPVKGPKSTDDVFVAAWELNDKLDDEIRTKCTGSALDAGPDAAACLKQFALCAGDIYINALPDCPK